MDLERNNIDTQLMLMSDIIQNDHNIFYHIQEKGKELTSILWSKKVSKNDEGVKTYYFTEESFDRMLKIASMYESERNFNQLGILAQNSVADNETKKKILSSLNKL